MGEDLLSCPDLGHSLDSTNHASLLVPWRGKSHADEQEVCMMRVQRQAEKHSNYIESSNSGDDGPHQQPHKGQKWHSVS